METVSLPKFWQEIYKSTLAKDIPKQVYMTAHRVNVFDQSDSGTLRVQTGRDQMPCLTSITLITDGTDPFWGAQT